MTNRFKTVIVELRGCQVCGIGFSKWEEWEEYVGSFPAIMRITKGDTIELADGKRVIVDYVGSVEGVVKETD